MKRAAAVWTFIWMSARRERRNLTAFRWIFPPLAAIVLLANLWLAMEAWRIDGAAIAPRAFFLAAGAAAAMAAHSALSTLKGAFGATAQYRLSLPLSSADLARVGLMANAADLAWLALFVSAVALLALLRLGPGALIWWGAALLGAPFWIWCGFMAGLALTRHSWTTLLLPLGSFALWRSGLFESAPNWPFWSSPSLAVGAAAATGAASWAVWGPLAGWSGRRYRELLQGSRIQRTRQGRFRRLSSLAAPLRGWRGPSGAFLFRGALLQSRSAFAWTRILAAAAAVAILAQPSIGRLRPELGEPWGPGVAAVILVWVLFVVDGCTSPIGSEGCRIQLLLTAPLSHGSLLKAKSTAFFLSLGGLTSVFLVGLLVWQGRDFSSWTASAGVAGVLLAGVTAIYALGSSLEADPAQTVPGGIAGRLFEEAPITGVRLALAGLGAVFLAGATFLLRSLPLWQSLPSLVLIDVVLASVLWPWALNRLAAMGSPQGGVKL